MSKESTSFLTDCTMEMAKQIGEAVKEMRKQAPAPYMKEKRDKPKDPYVVKIPRGRI